MKNQPLHFCAIAIALVLSSITTSFSQTPGYINRAATATAGQIILDPNQDGYTSKATSGFGTNDTTNSEIPYKFIPSFNSEPYGDLRRGPNHKYSDFVPDGQKNGFYAYFDGTNLLFRFRLGSIMPGSKGYSVLIDTDGKFGATGPNADPNYQPATTGVNGNPGFEIEIVLETNFDIAIYNVDGTSSPTLIKQYTNYKDMSQVSIAATTDNGDPDFFRDFYIPFSDLQATPFNLTSASTIRMVSTTVMAPKASIGGPKSDIYGLADNLYKNTNTEYEAYINSQAPFAVSNLLSTGSGVSATICTLAPTVNSPISVGTVNITGTWVYSGNTNAAITATITVYKNGTSAGTVAGITSGSTWTLSNITVANGDVITAKAQGTNEAACQTSNFVTVTNCNSSTRPTTPVLSCYTTSKGITGTNLTTGWTVHVDNASTTTTNLTIDATTTGTSPNITWTYSNGCSTGAPVGDGSYKVYYTNASGCASEPAYVCAGNNKMAGTLTVPSITSPANAAITTATSVISGTADANASLSLYVDGTIAKTTTASSAGAFTFSSLSLTNGQIIYIVSEYNTGTATTSKCENQTAKYTVTCYTTPPIITSDNGSQITAGQAITGISSEATGTIIKVYTSTNTLVATTTVLSDGTWSTANAGTTPSPYNAAASTTYYTTAQNGTCSVSTASGSVTSASQTTSTRCGSITGPISAATTSISGTLATAVANTTVNLYLDGISIGNTTSGTTGWGAITVSNLYPDGVLTIGIQESGAQEVTCPNSVTIACLPGATSPTITSPTGTTTIGSNQAVTYTISNAVSGSFYGISDSTTGQSLANGVWATANGNLSITTNSISGSGTHKLVLKSTTLSTTTMCSATSSTARVIVSSTLPVNLTDFKGWKVNNKVTLQWVTEAEINIDSYVVERSSDGVLFSTIGTESAKNNNSKSTYNFEDANPSAGINFYRLRIIEKNGKNAYSKVIVLDENGGSISINTVRPNPFTSEVSLNLVTTGNSRVLVTLLNEKGQQIQTKAFDAIRGTNTILLTNLGNLPGGMYLIRINTGHAVLQQKLIKISN